MSIATRCPSGAFHETVFIKTPKGRAEVAARSAGLKSRQRTLLIMLDGQKRLRDIAGLSPSELGESIGHLLALDLVAPSGSTEAPAAALPEPASARLADIKSLMTDSANTYLGLMAAEVVRRVQGARDEAALLSVVGHWHMAMRDSKYGRDAAETCLEHIRARFGTRGE
jgi:hypothetical protein